MNLLDLLAPIAENTSSKTQSHGGIPSPAWGALAGAMQRNAGSTLLLVAPNTELAERAAHDLHAILDEETEAPRVLLFPVPDRASGDEVGGDARAVQERLAVLDALNGEKPVIVVAPVNALAHTTLPISELRSGYDTVAVGQELNREEFILHLTETGFERVAEVDAPGQFAARGGLVDFFPPASEKPIRLELFGDEIDSLRAFDLDTQRSTDKLQEFRLTPPREEYLSLKRGREVAAQLQQLLDEQTFELKTDGLEEDAETLRERVMKDIARLEQGSYFPEIARYRAMLYPEQPTLFEHLPGNALVIWADPERARAQNERLMDDDAANRADSVASGVLLRLPVSPLCSFETLRARAAKFTSAEFHIVPDETHNSFDVHLPPSFNGNLSTVVKWVKDRQNENTIVVISTSHARRVREILADGNVHHVHLLDSINETQTNLVLLMPQRLTSGFTVGLPSPPRPPSPTGRERGELGRSAYASIIVDEIPSFSPLSRPAGEGGRRGEGRTPRSSKEMVERARALRQSQTSAEEFLWEILRDKRLDDLKFRRQHPIENFIADFFCREARLIIEVDGAIHAEPSQAARDQKRDEILQEHQYEILRLTNDEVLSTPDETVEKIRQVLMQVTPSPAPRPGALWAAGPGGEGKTNKIAILTDAELFGWQANLRLPVKTRKREGTVKFAEKSKVLSDLADLKNGDYVVHIQHGIARYAGVTRQEVGGATGDYLLLEYSGADRLYVPISQLDRVQKYLGAGAALPPLHKLRGTDWERTKKQVREEVAKIAKQLAELYAAREQAHKEPISPDSPWQREMESAFPYEETPSQLQAIKDSKSDLESDKPMDRLVCGDVGFGKTEVAVRAAFKVLQDGKQVAILVPTTVLAQQHYQTFSERLAPYPARVDVISRFRTPGEQRQILEDTKLGAVDILIGTHRILQKDVAFPNLGLVIVDEEQRFGVLQKERLKELRKEVDILTLSATPIPRTLHFALGGLREISLINDPPQGRLPVRTMVMPHRDEAIRQAIERELEREGQAYYVHNRIGSIYHVHEKLKMLVPHAKIGIGHGQMGPEELEQVMLDFMHRRTDVLLATTIIENGLDLPNVNTLIVDRAERLGLSQMYQLRGRVGRSNRQAYAYFFMGARGKIGEEAEERFAAIQEFTDLGAGFKIAMRDLEIRGAGDLLGTKQSGSIASVGFEMYADMLSEAVGRLKNIHTARKQELPEADLPVAAFLPDDYVEGERDRLQLYRKMAGVTQLEEVEHIQAELRDRFGSLPTPAFNLLRVLRIRVHLLHAQLRGIFKSEQEILVRLKPGDNFHDEDMTAVYGKLREDNDARTLQNLILRPREGLAIDTRVLTPPQLLRMTEQICESFATTRGARLLGV